ncbi:MAG: hypothetical protein ABW019_16205 [Chitinophagaceae bacterium]
MSKTTLIWAALAATAAGITVYYLRKRKLIREREDREKDRCRPFHRVSPGWEYTL